MLLTISVLIGAGVSEMAGPLAQAQAPSFPLTCYGYLGGSKAQWYLLPDPGSIPSIPEFFSEENVVVVAEVN